MNHKHTYRHVAPGEGYDLGLQPSDKSDGYDVAKPFGFRVDEPSTLVDGSSRNN